MVESVCIIGFGEAGAIFGSALAKHLPVQCYDILHSTEAFRQKAARFSSQGIRFTDAARVAAAGAEVVLSLVTAAAAFDVAQEAARYLAPGQIFLDLNSVSPGTKKKSAAAIENAGAFYVDGA